MARNKVRNSTGDSAWANSLSTVYKQPTRAGQKHMLAVCERCHDVHHQKRHSIDCAMPPIRPTKCGAMSLPMGYAIQRRKSEHLTITAAPDHVNNMTVYTENANLPVCQTRKHLGLYVDEQF